MLFWILLICCMLVVLDFHVLTSTMNGQFDFRDMNKITNKK